MQLPFLWEMAQIHIFEQVPGVLRKTVNRRHKQMTEEKVRREKNRREWIKQVVQNCAEKHSHRFVKHTEKDPRHEGQQKGVNRFQKIQRVSPPIDQS